MKGIKGKFHASDLDSWAIIHLGGEFMRSRILRSEDGFSLFVGNGGGVSNRYVQQVVKDA